MYFLNILQENFSVIFSYLMAIKVGNVSLLNYDETKNIIESILNQKHFNELIKSNILGILLKCIQMIVINNEQPIIPIQINSNQFFNIINIFQVN